MKKNGNGNGNGKDDKQQSFNFDQPSRVIKPKARYSDPWTSHEAAASFTVKRLSDCQTKVLEYFRAVKKSTDEKLEDYFKDEYSAQTTVSKRRTDLVHLDYLEDSGEWEWNRNNRRMIVWRLKEKK